MKKFKKITLLSAVGGTVFVAEHLLQQGGYALALTQDTADELDARRRSGTISAIINYLLNSELAADDFYITEKNTLLTIDDQQGILSNDDDTAFTVLLLIEDVQNGVLNLQSDGSFTYLPDPDFVGTDFFRYRLTNPGPVVSEATVNIKVNGQPEAIDDDFFFNGQSPFLGNVISNAIGGDDVIVDGAQVVAVINETTTLGGTISIQANGSFEYLPPASLGTQQDSFIYTLRDVDGETDTATITWQVGANIFGLDQNETVVENAVLNAQLTLFTPNSLEYIEFNSTRLTPVQLASASTSTPLAIADELLGQLSVTGFNAVNGVLDYQYDPTGTSQDHTLGINDLLTEAIVVRLKDTGLVTLATGTLNIDITDTNPAATNDIRRINEGTSAIAGNSVGISGSATGDNADTLIDANATPVTGIQTNTSTGTVGTDLVSQFGTYVINNAGVYTYTLDNTNPAVQGLKHGESLVEVFTYTITDGDGDTDTANFQVTIDGVEDALPQITFPGAGSPEEYTVAENATLTTGQIRLQADAGLDTNEALTVSNENNIQRIISLAELNNLASNNVVIAGLDGELRLTQYNSGSGTITFTFDPTGTARDHSSGSVIEQFTLVSKDNEGDTATETLDLLISDSPFSANDDTASITEDAIPNQIQGNNLLDNDTQGTDTPVQITDLSFDSATQTLGSTFATQFGTFQLDANGNYTYELDNGNSTVQALDSTQSLTEQFIYTLSDNDGSDTATLTVTINGADDIPEITIPNDDQGTAGSDVSVVENITVNGSFTIEDNIGLASSGTALSITDEQTDVMNLTLSQLQNLATINQSITSADGTLSLNSYSLVSNGHTIGYTFDPTGDFRDHSGGDTSIIDQYSLVAINADTNNSNPTSLDILITDTDPTANNDIRFIDEGFGGIIGNNVGTINSAPGDNADTLVDTNASPITDIDFGATDGAPGVNLVSQFGTYFVNNAGAYTYWLDNTNPTVQGLKQGASLVEVFTYTITDGDGDTDTANFQVTINGVEDALPTIDFIGAGPTFDYSVVENSTITGQIELAASAGFTVSAPPLVISNEDNSVVRNISISELENLTTANITINGLDGILELTGFNTGTGRLSFRYDPTNTSRDHSAGDLSVVEQFTLQLTDNENDTATEVMDILITDTAPTAAADSWPGGYDVTEDSPLNVTTADALTNDTSGADTAIEVVGVAIGGVPQTVGIPFATEYGTFDLNADGTNTYTLDNANATVNALNTGESLIESFQYTISDQDGDTSTSTITVRIQGNTD